MRLEPVYLVAPEPKPPSMPNRRAFLIAGVTFAVGTMAGGACGYSLGAAQAAEATKEPELQPSGDADLDELRRLAVQAPLDELFEKLHLFLGYRARSYRQDEVLWRGVGRLASEIVENPARAVEATSVSAVIAAIEAEDATPDAAVRDLLPRLRERRSAIRMGK